MPSMPWCVNDVLWETLSERALETHAKGHARAADRLWRDAGAIAATFATDDPRRAASLNNLAMTAPDGVARMRAAVAAWERAAQWVARMDPGARARGSTFHMRLEQRHREAYRETGRAVLRRALDEALAVTRFNLARLEGAEDPGAPPRPPAVAHTHEFGDARKLEAAVRLTARVLSER
ncbi:MAG: hypothetical protein ACREER_03860 [Alphaproteobacteria bacterium]